MAREGYDFDRLRGFYADEPRRVQGDELGELHVSTTTHERLKAAGIETVTAVRERLAAGTLGDVSGIGPTRAASIAEAVEFFDERQLPLDDPQLRRLAALQGLMAGMERLVAAANLLGDPEFVAVLGPLRDDVAPRARALLDENDAATTATRREAGEVFGRALHEVTTPAPSTRTAKIDP